MIRQPPQPSRMFNVRLTDEQVNELKQRAHQRHLPMATMAAGLAVEPTRAGTARRAS